MKSDESKQSVMSRKQTLGEEIANSITHGIGAVLSIVGLTLLIVLASLYGDSWRIFSFIIYGVTLVLLYTFSTLYHSFQKPKVKRILRIFDHSSIFLLIAGTYTPVLLINMRNKSGWLLFALIWTLAVLGILYEIFFMEKFKILTVVFYLGMGWLIVLAFEPLITSVPKGFLLWIATGGICYTIGVIFYALKPLKYHHMIWHLFVLAGSITHFLGMLFYMTKK
jgi:hemolysin III